METSTYPIPQSYSTLRYWNFKKIESFKNIETVKWNQQKHACRDCEMEPTEIPVARLNEND